MYELEFLGRYIHVLVGIVWIGMLYYFNFVQTEYFKEAEAGAKSDAMAKLAPRALWWFRWGAMLTFLTGAYLLHKVGAFGATMPAIWMGGLAGTFMFLNVWLIIWPNQQIVLGMKEGDGPSAAAKAGLASRTNTLFSGPMLLGMLASKHYPLAGTETGLYAALGLIVVLEANALFGGQGPMKSVAGVIHSSLALTLVIFGLLNYL
ncbi:MAG: urate hydroxylase PuuD [Cellvibrionales bacterium]|jgi:uncharacterized membrane protein